MKKNKREIAIFILVFVLILIDQASKWYGIAQNGNYLIPNFIRIELVENKGGAFGIGDGSTFTFIITNAIIIGIIIRFMLLQKEQLGKGQFIFLSLILAGGISNLIDRLIRGYVLDFIKIGSKFPSINLADIYIFIGWVLLVAVFAKHSYNELQERKKRKNDGD